MRLVLLQQSAPQLPQHRQETNTAKPPCFSRLVIGLVAHMMPFLQRRIMSISQLHAVTSRLRKLSPLEMYANSQWWLSLTAQERDSMQQLTTRRSPQVVARFVDDAVSTDEGNNIDFYEYLVNHEVYLLEPTPHIRHICTSHAAARERLEAGFVPSNFRCPRRDNTCPMRALLQCASGKAVRFELLLAGSE
jgi:hypothetical protein